MSSDLQALLVPWLPAAIGGLFALLCLWAAMSARRRRRLLNNLPTSKAQGVFIGLVELKGSAASSRPLTSHLAGAPCVWHRWSVEERWSRWVSESYTDSKGHRRTRMKHESGWTTVDEGGRMISFYIQDETGVVQVVPEGAKIEPFVVFEHQCGEEDPLYYAKGPQDAVSNSDHRRRFYEEAIPLGSTLYVVGQARERDDIVAPEIAHDDRAPVFLITGQTEQKITSSLAWTAAGWEVLALVLTLGGVFVTGHLRLQRISGDPVPEIVRDAAIASAIFGLVGATGWLWMAYNSLVNLRQRVGQAWSLVDVELKRRNDLIPNLVEIVRGIRDYEASLQKELAELRSQIQATPPGEPGPDHHACSGTIRAIVERYPDLSTQRSFTSLQEELTDTEQRIALVRAYFNDIASFYNTRLEVVPDRWVASLGGLQPRTLMTAADFERAPVAI